MTRVSDGEGRVDDGTGREDGELAKITEAGGEGTGRGRVRPVRIHDMKFLDNYKATHVAAYTGYVTQAVVNNLSPLLFVTFSKAFSMSLTDISVLITVNFVTQILVDLVSAKYIKKLGYRPACILAHFLATLGLLGFSILPFVLPPFVGLVLSTILCAIGGGMDEVIISPVIEAIPGDNKEADMSLLHSFYSWGQVLVVLGSTAYFYFAGIEDWRFLPIIWDLIPLADTIMFLFVPICELPEEENDELRRESYKGKTFFILFVIMICAGASELAMSQWASLLAEEGLGVSKAMGDILGPCMFAVFMGISRVIYGIRGNKMNLENFMILSGVLCIISYCLVAFATNPAVALMGCGLCGFSVGIMWPGTYSIGAHKMPKGGTAMFALLALGGDIGCTSGPDVAGIIGQCFGNIRIGLGFGMIFPMVLIIGVLSLKKCLT